jgi:hypothetical protein
MRLKIRIGAGIHHNVYVILPDGTEEPIEGVYMVETKTPALHIAKVTIGIFAKNADIEFEPDWREKVNEQLSVEGEPSYVEFEKGAKKFHKKKKS